MNKVYYANELYHYGVLGQKWGVRRFQNEDGTLTEEGKKRYGSDSILRNIARNELNTSMGQRTMVNLNKGYKKDKKEIKELYKKKKEGIKDKEQLKSLKSDYKKTLGEARTTAAEVMYPWQGKNANERIQTQAKGKMYLQSILTGGYGSMVYDRMRSNNYSRAASAGAAWIASIANAATFGLVGTGQYVYEKIKSEKKVKNKNFKNFTETYTNKDKKYNRALREDKWDLDFIEQVQNSTYYNDVPKLLKEYEKYLDDPENYRYRGPTE